MVLTENLPGRTADEIKVDYIKLVSDAKVKKANDDYSRQTRLDDHFKLLFQVADFEVREDLKNLVRQVLCLMHGQAAVERGFNVNKEILIANLQQKSLIAQRMVHDAICATGKPLTEFEISSSLMQAVRNSSRLYKEDIERKRKLDKSCSDQEAKKRRIEALVKEKEEEKKKMRQDLEARINALDNEIVQLRHD